jgi:putative hemin transport protein
MTVVRGPETMRERWTQLVRRFTSADQNPWLDLAPTASSAGRPGDRPVDARQLRRDWDAMQKPKDWTDMLQRLDLTAAQAIRLAGEPRARTAMTSTFKVALRCAANAQVPLSLTVETAGVMHNYTGLVRRIENVNEWLAAIEPGLRLYVCEPRIKAAWLVRRPVEQATVSVFHYFDAADQPLLTMTGNTIPGEPGLDRWERMVASL